ncbi:MAG: primosomal protein N' [Mariprofundaceae bacterium]
MPYYFVEVAVFAPLKSLFTYQWPESLGLPVEGLRIRIPFGRGKRVGMILTVSENKPDYNCKFVLDRLDIEPLYDQARREWLGRVERYYLSTSGETYETALAWADDDKRRFKCMNQDALVESNPTLAKSFHTKAAVSLKTIQQRNKIPDIQFQLLQALGCGDVCEVFDSPEICDRSSALDFCSLRPAQQEACDAIMASENKFQPSLLFGCTGSGKTEVYIQAAEALVANGLQILVLVPEIGLTPMWLERLQGRFGQVASWHSAMGARERISVRHQLTDVDVLIGTRSALFLPLPRLGLIVIDEEHDGSFKQQDGIAYSARDMSLLLAQQLNIPIVLGTATPSLESWRQVDAGRMTRLDLPERINTNACIDTKIIDMCGYDETLSKPMMSALRKTREAGQQSILFLNRRGYSPALQCTACGEVPECHACSVSLTLHRKAGQLRCHTCGFSRPVMSVCDACGEVSLLPLGAGTEKLEEQLADTLPELRVARFDRDVMTSQKRFNQVLQDFSTGNIDCLIGTQMLVKGHHFPNVTMVGVVNADQGLSMPDFRAGERWWQQMTQVVGRAGRGGQESKIIIQTRNPDLPWLQRIGDVHVEAMMNEELELRRQLNYPPFARWVRIVFSAIQAGDAFNSAQLHADKIRQWGEVDISGPVACPMERVAHRFRVELIIRDASRKHLPWKLAPLLDVIKVPSQVRRKVDVDPMDLM